MESLSSDEDQNIHGLSAKKKKPLISSSSSDDGICSPRLQTPKDRSNSLGTGSTRSSERINKRRNRTFSLPSRADRWKDIPSEKYTEKELRKLTPQKLINNFTKENHRYNYDPVYTSGEESMEEFINDASESESSDRDSDKPSRRKKPRRKVKNFHPRLVKESSSDSDENRVSDTDSDVGFKLIRNSVKRNSKCIESDSDKEDKQNTDKIPQACKNLGKEFDDKVEEENSDSDIPVVDRSRVCIIESDKEDDETETQHKIKELGRTEPGLDRKDECSTLESINGKLDTGVDKISDDSQDCLNETCRSNDKTTACRVGTSVDDSVTMHSIERKASVSDTSYVKLIDTGIPGDEIELNDASTYTSDQESDDSENQTGTSSESDIQVKSDRTREMMVKKKRKKEKLFEQFKAAREQKLQREAKRRQPETHKEGKDEPS